MPTTKKLHHIRLKSKINRLHTCFFTGHRQFSPETTAELTQMLDQVLPRLIREGYHTFLSGGARGFDLLAAQAVLRQREPFPHIRLIFVLPCEEHTAKWRQPDRTRIRELMESAGESICLYGIYRKGCMGERNLFMARHAGYCVSALRNSRQSGTAQTVRMTIQENIPVENLLDSRLFPAMLEQYGPASQEILTLPEHKNTTA